jgi:hypothetical protein
MVREVTPSFRVSSLAILVGHAEHCNAVLGVVSRRARVAGGAALGRTPVGHRVDGARVGCMPGCAGLSRSIERSRCDARACVRLLCYAGSGHGSGLRSSSRLEQEKVIAGQCVAASIRHETAPRFEPIEAPILAVTPWVTKWVYDQPNRSRRCYALLADRSSSLVSLRIPPIVEMRRSMRMGIVGSQSEAWAERRFNYGTTV